MSRIEVSRLTHWFGDKPVLDELDLSVPSCSVTAVLGESGCGKTTLLRAIAGLIRPTSGRIELGEAVVFASPASPAGLAERRTQRACVRPERRNVGLVPQEGALFPHLDVASNVGFGLRGSKRSKANRISELLALVGMADTESLRPDQLSGGMQQRVAVARALSRRPKVVLLDEPFSALDTGLRESVRADVFRAIAQDGATALLVTHDQEEALGVADQVAVMRAGRIVQAGSPATVYGEPVDRQAAAFLGESVELPATITGPVAADGDTVWRAECLLGDVEVRPSGASAESVTTGDRGTMVLRPEELDVAADSGLERAPTGAVATVESIRFHGHECLLRVRLAGGVTATIRRLGPPAFQPGDQVRVTHLRPPRFFAE